MIRVGVSTVWSVHGYMLNWWLCYLCIDVHRFAFIAYVIFVSCGLLTPTQFCRGCRSESPWTRSEEGVARVRWAFFGSVLGVLCTFERCLCVWCILCVLEWCQFVYGLFSVCVVCMMIWWTPFVYMYLGLTPCRSSMIVCEQVSHNTPIFSQDLANF